VVGPWFDLPLERLLRAGLFEEDGVRLEAKSGQGRTVRWRLVRTTDGLSIS
jgi:hypothetical protein